MAKLKSNILNPQFGFNLRTARLESKTAISVFCQKVVPPVKPVQLLAIERLKREPSLQTAIRFSDAVGVGLETLLQPVAADVLQAYIDEVAAKRAWLMKEMEKAPARAEKAAADRAKREAVATAKREARELDKAAKAEARKVAAAERAVKAKEDLAAKKVRELEKAAAVKAKAAGEKQKAADKLAAEKARQAKAKADAAASIAAKKAAEAAKAAAKPAPVKAAPVKAAPVKAVAPVVRKAAPVAPAASVAADEQEAEGLL